MLVLQRGPVVRHSIDAGGLIPTLARERKPWRGVGRKFTSRKESAQTASARFCSTLHNAGALPPRPLSARPTCNLPSVSVAACCSASRDRCLRARPVTCEVLSAARCSASRDRGTIPPEGEHACATHARRGCHAGPEAMVWTNVEHTDQRTAKVQTSAGPSRVQPAPG